MFSSHDSSFPPLSDDFLADARRTAHECAEAVRQIARAYFRHPVFIQTKADFSPVTQADKEAEAAMRDILARHYPDHAILGEENGQSGNKDSDFLWVLDPVDGTRAFVTGRPSFCTLIALIYRGIPVLGVIDQPVTQERWTGLAGQKTCYSSSLPGQEAGKSSQAKTRPVPSLAEAELSCTAPEIIRPALQARFDRLKQACKRISWGGDAYAYGLLSLGYIDFVAEDTLKFWDWAALIPVIEGAGGLVTDWHGQPLRAESDGTILACGNPDRLKEALEALRDRSTQEKQDETDQYKTEQGQPMQGQFP